MMMVNSLFNVNESANAAPFPNPVLHIIRMYAEVIVQRRIDLKRLINDSTEKETFLLTSSISVHLPLIASSD
jgi:hypothetical protein